MHWIIIYAISVALCCFHVGSEPLSEQEISKRGEDTLALSREIFKNITKHLRENISKENKIETDKLSRQQENGKVSNSKYHGTFRGPHHHEHHWGPYFEHDAGHDGEAPLQTFSHVGGEALLNCRVSMLKDKTVMWLRKTTEAVHLLTVGPAPHSADSRLAVKFQYPNNWRLSIQPVNIDDAGVYMCQISTHPPRALLVNVTVLPPVVTINGDKAHELKDRFYKAGSSIMLTCEVSSDYVPKTTSKSTRATTTTTTAPPKTTAMTTTSTFVNIIDLLVNESWSVKTTTITSTLSISTVKRKITSLPPTQVTTTETIIVDNILGLVWKKQGNAISTGVVHKNFSSTFSVAVASQNDSGTYSCQLPNHSTATVNVHVLSGENQAAVYHDTGNRGCLFSQQQCIFFIGTFIYYIQFKY